MDISVEISKYPLADDYIPPITDFIDRLNQVAGLTVITNTMSTQVFGEYQLVMDTLKAEMERSWQEHGKAIFVCKFIGSDLRPST